MRLLIFSLIGMFVFTLLIFTAQRIGEAQPLPEALRDLHLTDCTLPCWNGITLGTMQMGVAFQRLTAQYGAAKQTFFADGAVINVPYATGSSSGMLEFYVDPRGVVRQVRMYFDEPKVLTLGEIAGLLGMPTATFGIQPSTISYQCASTLIIIASGGSQRWFNPVEVFSISYLDYLAQPCALEIK